ncbi:MAG: DUF4403 family protein [Chitinispirillaceae bacterium]|nr:DUF4403 family protein [Chitinispirillaceae bacterium]
MKKPTIRSGTLAATLAGLLLCLACTPPAKVVNAPELPTATKTLDSPPPLPSFINVPIKMRTHVVEEMLNAQLTGLLFECDTLTLGTFKPVKIKVWKGDSIKITLTGDELRYTVPLRVWLRFSFTVGALGLSHTEYQDVEAALALTFRSRLFVKNDWKMVTMTQAEGYEWLSNPVVKVRFITLPIKPVADLLLSGQQKNFCQMIDKEINSVLNVKNLLTPLWTRMQDPILLSDHPRVWLRLTPQAVYMTQLQGVEGTIVSSAGIRSIAETFFSLPRVDKKQDSLPEFIIPGKVDSSFILNLYSEMDYDAAGAMLQTFLAGRSFTSGRREVIIENVAITGMDGYAVIGLDLVGSYRGKVYVFGKPLYDSATATVSIENLDFDLSTRSVVHKTADWLLHGIIISKVKPYLRFPLREKLLESQLMVQKMLCHSELTRNVFITGSIDSLNVGGVRFTDRAIQAILFCAGFAAAQRSRLKPLWGRHLPRQPDFFQLLPLECIIV